MEASLRCEREKNAKNKAILALAALTSSANFDTMETVLDYSRNPSSEAPSASSTSPVAKVGRYALLDGLLPAMW